MGGTTLNLCWSATWLGLDPSNLCPLKAQKLSGWLCQEIGVLIGNPMLIWMVNLCPSESQLLTEKLEFSKILFHLVGHSAKLSLAQFSFKLTEKQKRFLIGFWVLDFPITRTAEACFLFYWSSPPPLFWFLIIWWTKPINSNLALNERHIIYMPCINCYQ